MFQNIGYFLMFGFCLVLTVFVKSEEHGGLLRDISLEQRNKLDQFRVKILQSGTKFLDYQKKDGYLIRWLIAKDWDIELAAQFLYKAQQWRQNENVDSILNETILEFPIPSFSIDGVDFESRPVLTTSLLDLRSLILQGKKDKLLRLQTQTFELLELKLRQLSELTGREVDQAIGINDYTGFNLRQVACPACIDLLIRGLRNRQSFYPNIFRSEVLINVPRSAEFIVNRIRSQASQTSQVKIFGSDRTEWSTYLHKIIPQDQLTPKFGGTKE